MGFCEEEERKNYVDQSRVPEAANDSYHLFERLKKWSALGINNPEALSPAEIGQISFALSLYLAADETKPQQSAR